MVLAHACPLANASRLCFPSQLSKEGLKRGPSFPQGEAVAAGRANPEHLTNYAGAYESSLSGPPQTGRDKVPGAHRSARSVCPN